MRKDPMVATKIYIDRRTKTMLKQIAIDRHDSMSHVAESILCDYMLTYGHKAKLDVSGAMKLDAMDEMLKTRDNPPKHQPLDL